MTPRPKNNEFQEKHSFQDKSAPEEYPDFFQSVYDIVRLIPPGRVTSYGAIARCLGSKSSSRMVGWALNAAHTKPDVPAHRVVNRLGRLTGKAHFQPPEKMQALLEAEGVTVKDDAVVDFEKRFWDPEEIINF